MENNNNEENELSPERRERVIARSDCGRAYRKAARLREQADQLEAEDAKM
jgi:hypothetical protein